MRVVVGNRVELLENFGAHWRFRLPCTTISLAELFGRLEEDAKRLGIAEYTLSQATLEHVFNGIAQEAEGDAAAANP